MADLERYENRMVQQEVVQFDGPPDGHEGSVTELIVPILRRWYVIMATFIVVCGIGVPAIWFGMEQKYETTGSIRISPIVSRILFNDSDSDRPMPNYANFMTTEAERIAGPTVLNRVADELSGKKLTLLEGSVDPVLTLRQAANNGGIEIATQRHSELITIKMISRFPREAEQIVDAFIRSYMNIVRAEEGRSDDNKLNILEEQKRTLDTKIDTQAKEINTLLDEFGTEELDGRQEIMLQTVARLQDDLDGVTIRRIELEAQVNMYEKDVSEPLPEINRLQEQSAYINTDPTMQTLVANIRQYEAQIITDKQTMTDNNPELQNRIAILESFKKRMEERREELVKDFDDRYKQEVEARRNYAKVQVKAQLAQTIEHEKKIREELDRYDTATIGLGRKQLNIDDKKAELARTREIFNTVCNRISEIVMEQKRPARISIAEMASSVPAQSKRKKLALATPFGGIALGVFLAFLLAKADKRLRGAQDVVKRVGVRIIGTTTSSRHIDRSMITQQLSDDYQTIRANLGLFNGHESTKVLVVTSPGVGDGKTTFAINIALSFAQSGEKVLLIDGDLRKPDIADMLNLPKGLRGLQDMLFGKSLAESVYELSPTGLHILAADRRNCSDALDLLRQTHTVDCMKNIRNEYDHVIIDTPPVLASADPLVWAKMADAVIMACFAEHTSRPDLREAIERLEQIGVRVLGTVLNNVRVGSSYYRYGYGYGADGGKAQRKAKAKRGRSLLLVAPKSEQEDSK
ncbi:MAG: hypothetical protein DRP66_03550 [Planctomycetota bacterium]|nr:MAG: hypothetical protein DRP66_03550 [Planctomycetota bacterium]